MTNIAIANEVVEASILIEAASTKTAGSAFNAVIVLFDLINSCLIQRLSLGESLGLRIVVLLQSRTVYIDSGRNVLDGVTGRLDGVMGYFVGNLQKLSLALKNHPKNLFRITDLVKSGLLVRSEFSKIAVIRPEASAGVEAGNSSMG